MTRAEILEFVEMLALAGIGAAIFLALRIPAGGLLGALVVSAGATLAGRRLTAPPHFQSLLLMVTGTATGATVSPAALSATLHWPLSFAILAVATAASTWVAYEIFRRLGGCDRVTAFYATAPGALTAVMVLAQAQGADTPRVAVAQTLRLTVLALVSPIVLATTVAHPPHVAALALFQGGAAYAIAALGLLAGIGLAHALRWPTPFFLGPFAASAVLHGAGVVSFVVPPLVITIASVGLGALVGARFHGVRIMQLVRFLPPSIAALAAMAVVALSGGALAGTLSGVGAGAGMLAFAPGSMDVMIAIALATGLTPAYVATHHIARFLSLVFLLPFLAKQAPAPAE